jgi:hypothetical protein
LVDLIGQLLMQRRNLITTVDAVSESHVFEEECRFIVLCQPIGKELMGCPYL